MKSKKIIITILFTLAILLIGNKSYAAIQVVKGGRLYNVSASEAFEMCQEMAETDTSTLGNHSGLQPHMATSLDWGAAAYLGQSRYGANSSSVSTNTTGNESGVMDMNVNTMTATMSAGRNTTSSYSVAYRKTLEDAIASPTLSKYVDLIEPTSYSQMTAENTRGRALSETTGWYSNTWEIGSDKDRPMVVRWGGAFGVVYLSIYSLSSLCHGAPASNVTFRPILWN